MNHFNMKRIFICLFDDVWFVNLKFVNDLLKIININNVQLN